MIGVRIGRVVVIVVVIMAVVMVMTVGMGVEVDVPIAVIVPFALFDVARVAVRLLFEAAEAGAESVAELAVGHVRARRRGALAFDMVVVAFLNGANLGLEA